MLALPPVQWAREKTRSGTAAAQKRFKPSACKRSIRVTAKKQVFGDSGPDANGGDQPNRQSRERLRVFTVTIMSDRGEETADCRANNGEDQAQSSELFRSLPIEAIAVLRDESQTKERSPASQIKDSFQNAAANVSVG